MEVVRGGSHPTARSASGTSAATAEFESGYLSRMTPKVRPVMT